MHEIYDGVVGQCQLDVELDLELAPAELLDLEGEGIDFTDGVSAGGV